VASLIALLAPVAAQLLNCDDCRTPHMKDVTRLHRRRGCREASFTPDKSFDSPEACAIELKQHRGCLGTFSFIEMEESEEETNCACCVDNDIADVDVPQQDVYSFEPMISCTCEFNLQDGVSGPLKALVPKVEGNIDFATRQCSREIWVTGDIMRVFNFDVTDVQREIVLTERFCSEPIVMRFDDLVFSDDGVRFTPVVDATSCPSSPPEFVGSPVSLAATDGCLEKTNCDECLGTGTLCIWCFDSEEGHCLPKTLDGGGGDRCNTCSNFVEEVCPLPCPGLDADCGGHGQCTGDKTEDRKCECDSDWASNPPQTASADCAIYTEPADPCPNQKDAAFLSVESRSLVWSEGWLMVIWRAPVQGVAQLGVGVVNSGSGGPRSRRDDVKWRMRFGSAPVRGEKNRELNDFEWEPGTSTGDYSPDSKCLMAQELDGTVQFSYDLFQVVTEVPSYRNEDVWIAIEWPDKDVPVNLEVVFAEVRCKDGFAGPRCEYPIVNVNDRWFSAEGNTLEATVNGGVKRGGWHYVEIEVEEGTQQISAQVEAFYGLESSALGKVALAVKRSGLPPGKNFWGTLPGSELVIPMPEPSPRWFIGVQLLDDATVPAFRFKLKIHKVVCSLGSWGLSVTNGACDAAERELPLVVGGADTMFSASDWGKRSVKEGETVDKPWALVAFVPVDSGVRMLHVKTKVTGDWDGYFRAHVPSDELLPLPKTDYVKRGEGADGYPRPEKKDISGYNVWSVPYPVKGAWYLVFTSSAPTEVTVSVSAEYCDKSCQGKCERSRVMVCTTPEVNGQRVQVECEAASKLLTSDQAAEEEELPANEELYSCVADGKVDEKPEPMPSPDKPDTKDKKSPPTPAPTPAPIRTPSTPSQGPPGNGRWQGGGLQKRDGDEKGGAGFFFLVLGLIVVGSFVAGAVWHNRRQRRRRLAGEYDMAMGAPGTGQALPELDEVDVEETGTSRDEGTGASRGGVET